MHFRKKRWGAELEMIKEVKQGMNESPVEVDRTARKVSEKLTLSVLILATAGVVLQISGISWDTTSHGLGAPETFFTTTHDVLYTGIVFVAVASGLSGLLLRNKEFRSSSLTTGFKLMMIGACLDLVAGPSDFIWHETLGVDGLLSPPHLTLITGMLLSSIGVTVVLARLRSYFSNRQKMIKIL